MADQGKISLLLRDGRLFHLFLQLDDPLKELLVLILEVAEGPLKTVQPRCKVLDQRGQLRTDEVNHGVRDPIAQKDIID